MPYIPTLVLLPLALALWGCGGSPPSPSAPDESPPERFVFGRWEGILPCADCEGIQTTLTLYAEPPGNFASGYHLVEIYLGKAEGENRFETTGMWGVLRGSAADPDHTVYEINPDKRDQTRNFLRVSEIELRMLDKDLKEIDSALNYSLRSVKGTD